MAEFDDAIDDVEFQSSSPTSKPEDCPAVVSEAEENFHKVDIKPKESGTWKKKYSKGKITPQQKKDLYTVLDDILLAALRQEFEVCPGHTIDRLDMVKFLTSVVHQHLGDCPDLKKVLDLRDTVLTGRVKKAFPEVEYKRKQVKQDHYRKAWLYVNLRRKHASSADHCPAAQTVSTSLTGTWTTPTAPGQNAPLSHDSSSPSPPADKEHSPSSYTGMNTSYEQCSPAPMVIDEAGALQYQGSSQSGSGSDSVMSSLSVQFSGDSQLNERTGLVLDNLTLQKWVVSHYMHDDASYVPVQDVVKAFRKDFNVDISYKECHQMIFSAFTSPRNRLIPRKTVRVTSIGQQYVYRGIAPLNKAACSSKEIAQDADGTECAQSNYQSENSEEENEETWKQKIRDITDERNQALMERNQALTALMELEKEHAEAIRTIEKLKTEKLSNVVAQNASKTSKENSNKGEDLSANDCKGSSLANLLQKFGDAKGDGKRDMKRDGFAHKAKDEQYDFLLLKEVVTQAKEERDYLLKRLEIVKSERNSYLERLHSLEIDNQRLRDAVSARHSEVTPNRLLDDIARHFQTNSHTENDAKEALSSVLSHLKSKRKQGTPSRLNKSPKYDHANLNEPNSDRNSFHGHRAYLSPASAMDSGVPSPGNPDVSNGELHNGKERVCNSDVSKISNDNNGNLSGEERGSKQDLLVFTSGSGMIGFTRHPLED